MYIKEYNSDFIPHLRYVAERPDGRFDVFVYGRSFVVDTQHKAENLYNKLCDLYYRYLSLDIEITI